MRVPVRSWAQQAINLPRLASKEFLRGNDLRDVQFASQRLKVRLVTESGLELAEEQVPQPFVDLSANDDLSLAGH